jgi:hypothetical protein
MEHIQQEHPYGCMIAAAAMVLDSTYDAVSKTVPLQDFQILEETGINTLGLLGLDEIEQLALKQGKQMIDVDKPFSPRRGLRYIAMIPRAELMTHCIAIDETGTVFDPDPASKNTRNHWSTYNIIALLEFQPTQCP